MAKYSNAAQRKVEKVMREMNAGKLKSGRSGKKVTSRKQAVAIGLSEARKEGDKVPDQPSRRKSTSKNSSTTKKAAAKKSPAKKATATKKRTAPAQAKDPILIDWPPVGMEEANFKKEFEECLERSGSDRPTRCGTKHRTA